MQAANVGGQSSKNWKARFNNAAGNLSNNVEGAFTWGAHQSPCAAALCALGFLLVVFLACVIGTTSMFMVKTQSKWIQGHNLSLCGLEDSILQDPEAHLYMWWMVASILLFMVLLFYNGVAWAWYVVKKDKAPVGWLKKRAKEHKKKKMTQHQTKKDHHLATAEYAAQRVEFERTGEYVPQ